MPILRNTAALTSSGTSELDATTKANLARQWPEAVAGSGVSLPAISSRIYANGAGPYLGAWVEDFVNVLGFGDSLGHRVFAPLQDILVSRLGLAGIALGRIQYNAVSGTVVRAAPNTQRRTDLWGSGHAMQIQNGAVLEFGALEGGATVIPFKSNKVSIYLAMEPGGGTCSVEYSNDNRATWISLETGISTDNPSIAPLIKTYTFTGAGVIFRVTSTSGNVEMIGARMVHTAKKGVVLGLSATGGNPLTSAIAGNASIRTSVIADLAPHLVLSHFYESNADVVSAFDTYADQILVAAPLADHLYLAEHEQDGTGAKEADNNPLYRAKAATIPSLKIWETGRVFGGFDGLTAMDWNTSDAIHLEDDAWYLQASAIASSLGLWGASNTIAAVKSEVTGNSQEFAFRTKTPTVKTTFDWPASYLVDGVQRYSYELPGSGKRYWQWTRHKSDYSINPEGFKLERYTSSGINSALIFDKLGRSYFGTSNETTLLPRFEAAVFAHESSTGKHAIVGRHFSGTGSVFRGYQGLDIATLTTDIKADGTAKFATLDVSNWPTYADEAAAASAGIPVNTAYKTPTGELRFRVA